MKRKNAFLTYLAFIPVFIVSLTLIIYFVPDTSSALTYDKIPLAKISSTNPFVDINGNIHSDSIVWAYQYGITKGSPEGSNTYKQLDAVTRGSMATFLRRVIGNPEQENPAPTFTDIQGNIHKDNINWLASENITKGSPEGSNTYKPKDAVTRASMASFLYRLAGSLTYTEPSVSPFIDLDTSNIHYKAICWLKETGITIGSPANSNTYRPDEVVNRGSMATFLHRLYIYLLKDKGVEGKCSITKYVNKATCVAGGGIWTPAPNPTPTPAIKTYTVTFNANGGTGTTKAVSCTTTKTSCTVKLTKNGFTRSDHTFEGWNTKSDGSGTSYTDEQVGVVITKNTTLYAKWGNAPFTITFETTVDNEDIMLPTSSCIDSTTDPFMANCTSSDPYNWNITWDYDSENPDVETRSGASSQNSGITHTYATPGLHKILIRPVVDGAGWFRAFGFSIGSDGSNADANKAKVTSISGVITKHMMGLTSTTNYAYALMFCSLLNPTFTMADDFNIDQSITGIVGDGFAVGMFYACLGDAFTMGDSFNLPQGITSVGYGFAYGMFYACLGDAFTMGDNFSLPQSITSVGDGFTAIMFANCRGNSFTMGNEFNFPQGIKGLGDNFAYSMFEGCYGDKFTMGDNFNFPQGIRGAGDNFAALMFYDCHGSNFTISDTFTFPEELVTVGEDFAYYMFRFCNGAAFTMGDKFNFSQDITEVGEDFASNMFQDCNGDAFTMNDIFNFPQGITEVGAGFADSTFLGCSGASFEVNPSFKFPKLNSGEVNKEGVFLSTFAGITNSQTTSAIDIINGNDAPSTPRSTFPDVFSDYGNINANWRFT